MAVKIAVCLEGKSHSRKRPPAALRDSLRPTSSALQLPGCANSSRRLGSDRQQGHEVHDVHPEVVLLRRERGLHLNAGTGKQSKKTLLDIFECYIERYMPLFDAIWSV